MKQCVKCEIIKEHILFNKNKQNKDGYSTYCKLCIKECRKKYKSKTKEYNIKYKKENIEKLKEYQKKYKDKNKTKIKEQNKKYKSENRNKINKYNRDSVTHKEWAKQYQKKYRNNNLEKIKEKRKNYYSNNRDHILQYKKQNKDKINKQKRNRYKSLINKITSSLRNRMRSSLKGFKKSNTMIKLLGCTSEQFVEYIESKFTKGMTWENYGLYGWHLDHIMPCASFDLSSQEQQKICFHYTNIQPLWATTKIALINGEGPEYIGNIEKGKKLKTMKFLDLNYKEHIFNIKKLTKENTNPSKLHLLAKSLIKNTFPMSSIYEEVLLPGMNLIADFFIPDLKVLIEVQGEQHYKFVKRFHKTQAGFIKSQKRDKLKQEWCDLNDIIYIELPFNKKEEWADIIGENL